MVRAALPGFRFRDGKLIVCTEEEVKIVHTWPSLVAIRKGAVQTTWTPLVPCFRLLRPTASGAVIQPEATLGPPGVKSAVLDPAWEKHLAFALFRRSIPPEVARAVERFTNRQWAMLAMCRHRLRAKDLLEQSPALGFSLAHHVKFRGSVLNGAETAARASALKHREILRWLGFPDSQAWANILTKIPAEIASVERLVSLRDVSANAQVERMLSHVLSLNVGALELVTDRRLIELVSPALLAEVAVSPEESVACLTAHLLADIVNLRHQMKTPEPLSPFRSRQRVREKQQETVEEYARFLERQAAEQQARRLKLGEEEWLPEPPLPGTPDIVPLKEARQLREEGSVQHHCVGSYVNRVKQGQCYIYRILSPERATLALARGPDGGWGIEQLYRACNQPVGRATRQAVEAWLGQFSLSV